MLIQFNFSNFKSFRDEATLDLSAAKMTEFSNRVISVGNEKILPVAAVYGANASGKSNVYGAFEYMTEYRIAYISCSSAQTSWQGCYRVLLVNSHHPR